MNTLQFLKNGSGIHIKESKKGSFTKYCNGKVTDECIAKGKRSPSAAIRKKATFAANSRKWHHKDGNLIKKGLFGIPGGLTADKQEIDRRNQAFFTLGNKLLNEGGFNKPGFKHLYSDLLDLGILSKGGENGTTYGIVSPGISRLKGLRWAPKNWTKVTATPEGLLYFNSPKGIHFLDSNGVSTIISVKKNGGLIKKAQEGTKFDWVGLGTNLLKTYTQNKKISSDIEAKVAELQAKWADAKKKLIDESIKKLNLDFQLWMADYQSGTILDLPSLIVSSNRAWKDYSLKLMSGEQDINNKIAQLKASLLQLDNWSNFLLEGLGQVGNYLSSKIPVSKNTNNSFNNSINSFTNTLGYTPATITIPDVKPNLENPTFNINL